MGWKLYEPGLQRGSQGMTDRTTKILLGSIALGLWANLFVPLIRPTAALAQYENDYILKSIDARLAGISVNIERLLRGISERNYFLKSMDGRLATIDGNIDQLQRGTCSNGKLCLEVVSPNR